MSRPSLLSTSFSSSAVASHHHHLFQHLSRHHYHYQVYSTGGISIPGFDTSSGTYAYSHAHIHAYTPACIHTFSTCTYMHPCIRSCAKCVRTPSRLVPCADWSLYAVVTCLHHDLTCLHDLTWHDTGVDADGMPNNLKTAVQSLCFGIPKGECFGFLGINGGDVMMMLVMIMMMMMMMMMMTPMMTIVMSSRFSHHI